MKILAVGLPLVLLLGCGPSASLAPEDPDSISIVFRSLDVQISGGAFCCDPDFPFPQTVGTIRIENLGGLPEVAVQDIALEVRPFPAGTVVATPDRATIKAGESVVVTLEAVDCGWSTVEADLAARPVEKGATGTRRLQVTNICAELGPLLTMGEEFSFTDLSGTVEDTVNTAATGVPVDWSGPTVTPLIPSLFYVEIALFGAFIKTLADFDVTDAFFGSGQQTRNHGGTGNPAFPCGAGDHAFTVCPSMPAQMPPGEYVFAYIAVKQDITVSSNRFRTYGFVFDGDGDPTNNYVPPPAFPDDYFKDTDRWYVVDYVPGVGWTLYCRDATNSIITEVPTAARALILGNVVLLVVARSEFLDPEPSYRVTAFTHTGDFGANPPHDWAGDQHPRVSEGLAPFVRAGN